LEFLRVEIALKIRGDFRQGCGRLHTGKILRRGENARHLFKIIRIVRSQENATSRREHSAGKRREWLID